MRRGWRRILRGVTGSGLALCSVVFSAYAVAAQEPVEEPRQRFEFVVGTWISTGETSWAHNASSTSSLLGNPTSKLTYKDVETNVIDLTGTLWFTPRVFGRLNVGFASIGGGRLTDDDYLAADGGNPSSQTFSDLNGDGMWYLNADFGGRVKNFTNHRGWLDLFGGFQYWHTQYSATGLGQAVCTPAGANTDVDPFTIGTQPLCPTPSVPGSTTVITNTTNWYSIRLGGRAEYRLTRQLSVQGSVALLPISILDNKDIHHLRSDLQQNPSISMLGYGIGADADVGVKFMFTRKIGLNLGYRVWWNRMLDGTATFHGVADSSEYPLTQFQSFRQGLTAGLNIAF